jgi:AcrR family transcriptional regulator
VHYYFKSKEELVAAAVEAGCPPLAWPEAEDPTEAARLAFEQGKQAPDERTRLFQSLFLEMLGPATRMEPVRETLLRSVEAERSKIEEAARAVIAQRGEGWTLDQAPVVAAVVWAASFGINVQRQLDPGFDAGAAIDVLTELVLR